jgi:F0F1-type ATP synthase assembly protein I
MDDNSNPESSNPSSPRKKSEDVTRQSALALELPFTLVGAVVVGGALGYFLDKWLHTGPWLLVILGAAGFYGGVREVIRRLPGDGGPKRGQRTDSD